jgi:hypothetical protein
MVIIISYTNFHLQPPAVLALPLQQSEMLDDETPVAFTASLMETNSLIILPLMPHFATGLNSFDRSMSLILSPTASFLNRQINPPQDFAFPRQQRLMLADAKWHFFPADSMERYSPTLFP